LLSLKKDDAAERLLEVSVSDFPQVQARFRISKTQFPNNTSPKISDGAKRAVLLK